MWRSGTSFLMVLRILARSFWVRAGVDVLCPSDIVAFLVRSSESLRANGDGIVSQTVQSKAGPVIRNGLGTVSLKHVAFRRGQSVGDRDFRGQMSVEALH